MHLSELILGSKADKTAGKGLKIGGKYNMFYFMKPLPKGKIDTAEWNPFIKNQWFRNHFMYFVYCLQVVLVLLSSIYDVWDFSNILLKSVLFIGTYLIHEFLHVAVIYKAGDISLTHSGIFFWITSGAVLSKLRFFLFMSLPFVGLTIVPTVLCCFIPERLRDVMVYIAWVNSIIAGSDIINSVLIAIKPRNSMFYRGYYKC